MYAIKKAVSLEHLVDAVMFIFAIASIGNISEYMSGHGHNPFTAYGVGLALGLGLVAISFLLARIPPSDQRTFRFMLIGTTAVGMLSGAVQFMAYREHGQGIWASLLQGFGFPLIGECLLAVAMSVYSDAQKRKRMMASDDQMNERINEFLNRSLDDVDLTRMTAHVEKQVSAIVRNKIDAIVRQRLAQDGVGRAAADVGQNSPAQQDQHDQDGDITTSSPNRIVELNEARRQKVADRRVAIVRMLEAYGAMGAPDLVEKLLNDCGVKTSAQTVRDDCAALVDDRRLLIVGRKWDVVRERIEVGEPAGADAHR